MSSAIEHGAVTRVAYRKRRHGAREACRAVLQRLHRRTDLERSCVTASCRSERTSSRPSRSAQHGCESLIAENIAVADVNFVLDYFRRSDDHRLLFGGRVSYSGRDARNTERATRARMLKVFPSLADAKIEYAWGGTSTSR